SDVPLLRGIVLRAFDGQGFVEFATDGAPRAETLRAAKRLARVAVRGGIRAETSTGRFDTVCEIDPVDVSTEDKFARVRELQATLRALHPKAVNARATYSERITLQRFRSPERDLVQRVVRVVATAILFVAENGRTECAYGSFFFDDEGHLARPTTIIQDGIYIGGLADDSAALALGYPATPNGRRESYRRKAYARMTNTFFVANGKTPDELIASIDSGIYLDRGSSGMDDPKSCGIQVTMRDARQIRGGKLTDRYFKEVGVTGYVPEVL